MCRSFGSIVSRHAVNNHGGPQSIVHGEHMEPGLMTRAMAWRVKYRKTDADQRVLRCRTAIKQFGSHMGNRGGVYAAGVRCKSLAETVILNGFLKEEVNHAVVGVEETPTDSVRSRGEKYVSGRAYNIARSKVDELLCTCFQEPYDNVQVMLLTHNHIMLVIRAFMTQAKWDIKTDEAKDLTFCDDKGRLSLSAVAEHPNGKELADVVAEGIDCEILSWHMDHEEPTAAALISQALNKGHELAMRTTELTAVAVLKGEIITQLANNVFNKHGHIDKGSVNFRTVRDRVREQLDVTADDPDLPEVFDFLIQTGVGTNSYVDDMMEFGSTFVDSKKRQLRLSAFGVVNRVSEMAPWVKISLIKRAWRKKPVNGFCPSPEPLWADVKWDRLEKLEEVLRFFHVANGVAAHDPKSRTKLMANIDVVATDAFYVAEVSHRRKAQSMKCLKEQLLKSVETYVEPFGITGDAMKSVDTPWIDFKGVAGPVADQPAADTNIAPVVIKFDEKTGKALNGQVDFQTKATEEVRFKLPWREWLVVNKSCGSAALGVFDADKASAVAAIHAIHENFDVAAQKVDVWQTQKVVRVVATEECVPQTIMLPPCVPKQSRVYEKSDHPHAVKIKHIVKQNTQASIQQDAIMKPLRESTFFVLPEFKAPLELPESKAPLEQPAAEQGTAVSGEKKKTRSHGRQSKKEKVRSHGR